MTQSINLSLHQTAKNEQDHSGSADVLASSSQKACQWDFIEVRTKAQLDACDALILPGGESTTISLVAARSNLLEPLRDFVKNHFGRQTESFQAPIDLPFLQDGATTPEALPFNGVFIRAPVVEKILPHQKGIQIEEDQREETVVAPSREVVDTAAQKVLEDEVEVLAKLPGRAARLVANSGVNIDAEKEAGDIIAVKQGNVFGTSFHPELTDDPRIHLWWLRQVQDAFLKRNGVAA
ncbi:hypothetical protein EIK77_009041 [Talaromyces pinophilus]|nr:hypothetical protein EIK77_009041 [Talaromyces pinophilus]